MKEMKYSTAKSGEYKCITVKSITYAQKAKRILAEKGIDGYLYRGDRSEGRSCHWCVKVKSDNADRAYGLLLDAAVPLTGEIYEIR